MAKVTCYFEGVVEKLDGSNAVKTCKVTFESVEDIPETPKNKKKYHKTPLIEMLNLDFYKDVGVLSSIVGSSSSWQKKAEALPFNWSETSEYCFVSLGYVCSEIISYMVNGSWHNAKHLFDILNSSDHSLICEIKYVLERNMDVDGDRPYEVEYCDKFVGLVRSNPKWLAAVSSCAMNMVIDVIKTSNGYRNSPHWFI